MEPMDMDADSAGRLGEDSQNESGEAFLQLNSSQELGSNAWDLLAMARQLIKEGKPSVALQAVVMAVKSEGGDQAVLQTLNRARELYQNKVNSAAADQLASLFAECVIAEAQPQKVGKQHFSNVGNSSEMASMKSSVDESSILAESGRKQIMLDAVLDGSSFICLQCGGLVSNQRKDEHLAYWCCGTK